jgi:hypothetical protein
MTLGCDRAPIQKALIQDSPFDVFFSAPTPTHNIFQVLNVKKSLVPMYQIDGPQNLTDGWSIFLLFGLRRFLHKNLSTNLFDHRNNNYTEYQIDGPQEPMDGQS